MNLFLHFLVFWHFYLTYVLSCLCGFPSKFSDFWIKTVKKQAVFQILVTYAFTQNGICTVRHSRELWKCRRKKNLRRIFRSKTYHNLINVAWLFDGKTHVFVLKSVVVCGTDLHKRLWGHSLLTRFTNTSVSAWMRFITWELRNSRWRFFEICGDLQYVEFTES